jgi:hypothetical protein
MHVLMADGTPTDTCSTAPAPLQVLTARVLELKMDTESKSQARTWVDVSTRSADLADWRHWERQLIARHDAHYHIPSEEEEQTMMRARQQQVGRWLLSLVLAVLVVMVGVSE